jgi:uncharacterized protein Yka (UPF0111/DUF47 family)
MLSKLSVISSNDASKKVAQKEKEKDRLTSDGYQRLYEELNNTQFLAVLNADDTAKNIDSMPSRCITAGSRQQRTCSSQVE